MCSIWTRESIAMLIYVFWHFSSSFASALTRVSRARKRNKALYSRVIWWTVDRSSLSRQTKEYFIVLDPMVRGEFVINSERNCSFRACSWQDIFSYRRRSAWDWQSRAALRRSAPLALHQKFKSNQIGFIKIRGEWVVGGGAKAIKIII